MALYEGEEYLTHIYKDSSTNGIQTVNAEYLRDKTFFINSVNVYWINHNTLYYTIFGITTREHIS